MRPISRLTPWLLGLITLSCGFNRVQPCGGQTPCQLGLTPAQLQGRHYQHIVVVADVLEQPTTRGPTSLDGDVRALRASLAAGLSVESLEVLHPAATILFDSTYHQDHDLGPGLGGFANVSIPDTSWRRRWPSADAVLEISQYFPTPWRYCANPYGCGVTDPPSCCVLVMYLWDMQTDSAAWIKVESLGDIHLPPGQKLLGTWLGPATVKLLQEARVIN